MNWKKIGKSLLFPNVIIIIILTVISAVSLVHIFMNGLETAWIAYIAYVFSFYTLTVLVIFLSIVLPKQYRAIKQKIMDNPFGNRYLTDTAFRTQVSLYMSLGINLLYAGINVISFVVYNSRWFIIFAVYYMTLAVMRFLLLRYARRDGIGQNRLGELGWARVCSCILLTVNFVLSGAVLMILYADKGAEYAGTLIYVMALYTFYTTISAIINLVKYRKYKSPVMTTTKIIALSAALVSMLSLETAMFSQFGQDMDLESQRLMITLTGAGISMAVIGMSSYMIVKTSKEIGVLKDTMLLYSEK